MAKGGTYRSKGKVHANRSGKTQTKEQKALVAKKKKRAKVATAAKGIAEQTAAPEDSTQHDAVVASGAAQAVRNRQSRPGRAQELIKNRRA